MGMRQVIFGAPGLSWSARPSSSQPMGWLYAGRILQGWRPAR